MKIAKDKIIEAALALLQEEGLDRLSMRTLAARMGVQASAFYRHVASKDELLALISFQFYAKAVQIASDAPGWRAWLNTMGQEFRLALLGTRDAGRLCSLAGVPSGDPDLTEERLAAPLMKLGLTFQEAWSFQVSVMAFTLGWVIYQQSDSLRPHLVEILDFDESHAAGLRALVEGLKH